MFGTFLPHTYTIRISVGEWRSPTGEKGKVRGPLLSEVQVPPEENRPF